MEFLLHHYICIVNRAIDCFCIHRIYSVLLCAFLYKFHCFLKTLLILLMAILRNLYRILGILHFDCTANLS